MNENYFNKPHINPRGEPYDWICSESPTGIPELVTDIGALSAGNISITPLQMDLTAFTAQKVLANWQWKDQQVPITA